MNPQQKQQTLDEFIEWLKLIFPKLRHNFLNFDVLQLQSLKFRRLPITHPSELINICLNELIRLAKSVWPGSIECANSSSLQFLIYQWRIFAKSHSLVKPFYVLSERVWVLSSKSDSDQCLSGQVNLAIKLLYGRIMIGWTNKKLAKSLNFRRSEVWFLG